MAVEYRMEWWWLWRRYAYIHLHVQTHTQTQLTYTLSARYAEMLTSNKVTQTHKNTQHIISPCAVQHEVNAWLLSTGWNGAVDTRARTQILASDGSGVAAVACALSCAMTGIFKSPLQIHAHTHTHTHTRISPHF